MGAVLAGDVGAAEAGFVDTDFFLFFGGFGVRFVRWVFIQVIEVELIVYMNE